MISQEPDNKSTRRLWWGSLAVLLCLLLGQLQHGLRGISDYSLEEWLMRFPGHFIRRGLRGSVISVISDAMHLAPIKIATLCSGIAYALIAFAAARLVFGWLAKNAPSFVVPVLFSPAGFFFYFNSVNGAYRFDVVFLLITAAHVEICCRSKSHREYVIWATALFASLGTVAMLSNEVFLFVGIPINAMLTVRRLGKLDLKALAIFGAPLIAAIACFLHPGTKADAATIYQITQIKPSTTGPIYFIGMSAGDELRLVSDWTIHHANWLIGIVVVAMVALHLRLMRHLLQQAAPAQNDGRPLFESSLHIWKDLLLVPMLCTLPLYPLGYDFTRWMVIPVAMFTLTVCRVTVIPKTITPLNRTCQVIVALVCLFVAAPGQWLAPTRALIETSVLSEVMIGYRLARHQPVAVKPVTGPQLP